MSTENIKLGKQGENHAVDFLRLRGFDILDCNFRFKRAEVDIIATKGQTLCFVEVKSRTGKGFYNAEHAVDKTKQELYFRAAQEYLKLNEHVKVFNVRFDVIVIEFLSYGKELFYFPDAFYPVQTENPRF